MNSDTNGRDNPANQHPSFSWEHTMLPIPPGTELSPAFQQAMTHPSYPLSAAYDPRWIFANAMGPIPTWQVEELALHIGFEPGQRVLDLGCGVALTSIFMAREFAVEVTAADLWVDPSDNALRIAEAGCDNSVTPISAEAHSLPFAHGYFDAIVSFDAYHYFGTDVRYLSYLAQFVKPGGRIGIVSPANSVDPDEDDAISLQPGLADAIGADWFTFRSAGWWRRHWSRTLCIDVELAEMLDGGRKTWLRQCDAAEAWSIEGAGHLSNRTMLDSDAGQAIGFCMVVARRNDKHSLHFGPGEFATRIA